MKTTNNFKLAAYSAMALPFLIISEKANAQINYVDLDPDISEPADGEFPIDFDGNGTEEVNFVQWIFGPNCFGFMGLNEYQVSVWTDGNGFAKGFDYGDAITGSYSTNYNVVYLNMFYAPSLTYGPLVGVGDKYIGLSFEGGGLIYNAWIRLNIDACGYLIKDYAFSTEVLFAGEGTPESCLPPVPLDYLTLSPTTVKVKWTAVEDAIKYQIKYRPVGAPAWMIKNITAPATTKKLNGLTCETDYEWKIRVQCSDGDFSDYSGILPFTTSDCRIGETPEISNEISLFPNPANQTVTVYFDNLINDNSVLSIYDLSGKKQMQLIPEINSDNLFEINIQQIPNGIYLVELNTGSEKYYKELVVQK